MGPKLLVTAVAMVGLVIARFVGTAALAAAPPSDESPHAAGSSPAALSSNAFAAGLWGAVAAEQGNLVVSPASIWIALVMTEGGARGVTREEMRRVLAIAGEPESARAAAGELVSGWNAAGGEGLTLRVANRLFGEKSYAFEAPFLRETGATFGAPLEPLDFRHAPEPSRARINQWVEERTERRIADLLPPGSVDPETRLVLANAVYFLGKWKAPFTREATRDAPFHLPGGEAAQVATMHQVEHFGYAEKPDLQVLEMPYRGGELAMVLVLPRERQGLAEVEAQLRSGALAAWLDGLAPTRVMVALPKFTIDPPEALALADALRALGMPTAFDPARADFTGMANPADPADRLCISEVFHKAFVKVDEEGTEAAAASAVSMMRATSAPDPGVPPEFRADHPFLFFLRDTRSGMILFAGRLVDPRPSSRR